MAGSIVPLPVMLEEEDRKIYEKLQPPKTMVLRYGYMKLIGEFPYDGDSVPGCGSRLVIRSDRGTELATMLTTTCSNSGCGSSVSRKQMLQYIENSGGKKYPFSTKGKVVRVATVEDLRDQERQDARKRDIIKFSRQLIAEQDLDMRLVEIEILLGGERMIFHYTAEQWVDFRELVKQLAAEYQTRIEMHQVNARDEARVVADYEKCGQYCCCKQFLKVLKPVSMRSAKIQKATLDPQKISGRCGRLMCCLRYEDETYDQLRKNLPHRQTRVMTDDGPGTVLNTQILTQLALVKLDAAIQPLAFPVEDIRKLTKEEEQQFKEEREAREAEAARRAEDRQRRKDGRGRPRRDEGGPKRERSGSQGREDGQASTGTATDRPKRQDETGEGEGQREGQGKGRRRRRGRRGGQGGQGPQGETQQGEPRRPQPGKPLTEGEVENKEGQHGSGQAGGEQGNAGDAQAGGEGGQKKKRRRRRRRRGRGNGPQGEGGQGGNQGGGGSSSGGGQGGGGGSGGPIGGSSSGGDA